MSFRNSYSSPSPEKVLKALKSRFRAEVVADARRRIAYFDTFDWRLHRSGGFIRQAPSRSGPMVSWLRRDGSLRHRLSARVVPPFAWDFPAGEFRREVEEVIAMRRLLEVVELRIGGFTVNLLDRRDKTVARARFEEGVARASGPTVASGVPGVAAAEGALRPVLRLQAIRGYDRAFESLVRFVESDLGLEDLETTELELGLAAIGRRAGDVSSKVEIELDGAMPAAEAAKIIHRTLLAAIQRNEQGTVRDLDSEFLHDFRVAVRRTRSALSQIKGVFAEEDLTRFKGELAWLGGLTGPTRDLDVYLLKMEATKAELAESVRQDLDPLNTFLVAEQRREQRKMARALASPRYRSLLESWGAFLQEPADLDGPPEAGRPIARLASERIWKVYRRVIKDGSAIDDDTPAEAVHALRIRCKKLRYLMEFFRSLYQTQKIERLIKALKRLQDNLGDFNDYEVQQVSLKGFAEAMQRRGSAPAATLMAMGRLVEHLEASQARERQRVTERFASFSKPANQALAGSLFNSD